MISAEIEVPKKIKDLGVRRSLLEDLALKILYYEGELTLLELSKKMCVSFSIVELIFDRLRKEQLCEVKGMTGTVHRIAITSGGRSRALELLNLNHYYGPAPVSLEDYVARVRAQSIREAEVRPPQVKKAFSHLVLPEETLNQLGTAVVSGRCIILYGPAGTGKTAMAEGIPAIYGDRVWIPYAVEVDGQIITVYDSHLHGRYEEEESNLSEHDRRWVLCRRPRVVVGGELTLEMLDLQMNPLTKFYTAPLQMKANNGVLVVDDFGRQECGPKTCSIAGSSHSIAESISSILPAESRSRFRSTFSLLLQPTSIPDHWPTKLSSAGYKPRSKWITYPQGSSMKSSAAFVMTISWSMTPP